MGLKAVSASAAPASNVTVTTSVITGGTTGRVLYDNAGTLGETANIILSTAGVANLAASIATPASGSATAFVQLGTTPGLGIYFGSGPPTVSGAGGSLYLNSTGSTTATRLFVCSTGTTWVAVTTTA